MAGNKIVVTSKPQFNQFMGDNGINDANVEKMKGAFISINDTMGNWSVSWFDEDHPNVLRLWFDDVETDLEISPTNREVCRAFTKEQAQQIIDFALDNKDKDFIVHCSAGISRSGAVGRFLLDFLEGDKDHFEKTNRFIHPNGHISRVLNNLVWNHE